MSDFVLSKPVRFFAYLCDKTCGNEKIRIVCIVSHCVMHVHQEPQVVSCFENAQGNHYRNVGASKRDKGGRDGHMPIFFNFRAEPEITKCCRTVTHKGRL